MTSTSPLSSCRSNAATMGGAKPPWSQWRCCIDQGLVCLYGLRVSLGVEGFTCLFLHLGGGRQVQPHGRVAGH